MNNLSTIPQIGKFVNLPNFAHCHQFTLLKIVKELFSNIRNEYTNNPHLFYPLSLLIEQTLVRYQHLTSMSLTPLINATGIVLHTNLGRSPLGKDFFSNLLPLFEGYCNVEFNTDTGQRGERYSHLNEKLAFLLGCEDVLIVNNNAAAVFLILHTFAQAKQVIVSRGELVEIGGAFRIPEVMKASGALLCEVGTTNKTKIHDYEMAINDQTAMLMKVHRSNFALVGFCEDVPYNDLITLAHNYQLIDYYDLGSLTIDSFPFLGEETDAQKIFSASPSLVSFSGDKLFGSLQAGIIGGKKELISQLKKNQLLRMLRVDKLTLATLEATIIRYLTQGSLAIKTIELLSKTHKEMFAQAHYVYDKLLNKSHFAIIETSTYVGGGSVPEQSLASIALQWIDKPKNAEKNLTLLREKKIIARIEKDCVVCDFHSIDNDYLDYIITVLNEVA